MRRKILVTASTFPRYEGDTEPRFVLDLCKELKNYYDVTVLVPAAPNTADEEYVENVHIIRYHYFFRKLETLCYPGAIVPRIKEKKIRILLVPFLMIALFINLKKREKDYDIVHAHWIIPQGLMQCFVKTPYIVTGHGGDVTSFNSGLIRSWKRLVLKRAKYVTAVSPQLLSVLESISGNKVDISNKTAVISMGCDVNSFGQCYRVENYFRDRYGINTGDKPVILYVGRLAEKKGVRYLIEAMHNIDANLVIAGDGSLRSELTEQANLLNKECGEKIFFLGAKTHSELREIYASADVFCAPSVVAKDGDTEGFGLVILEAMASGLPVVASRSGGIVSIIKDMENGVLTTPGDSQDIADKISMVLGNERLYDSLSEQAILTAKQYDYQEIGKRYHEVFERVLIGDESFT